jgi:hypothetical protein
VFPLSAAAAAALKGSASVSAHIDVTRQGVFVPGFQWIPVRVAKLTVDRTATTRRTATVEITDPQGRYAPTSQYSPLAANGNEVRLWYDVWVSSTQVFSIPMGWFAIQKTNVVDTGADFVITTTLADRSWEFGQRGFVQPYTVAAGVNIDAAIMTMLQASWAGNGPLLFALNPTPELTPSPAAVIRPSSSGDPWTQATRLADAAGFELFFDAQGQLVGRPPLDMTKQPAVWAMTELQPNGMKGVTFESTREGVHSAWVIIGKGSTTKENAAGKKSIVSKSIFAYAEDDNPASSTYAKGPFGVVPQVTTSSLASTQEQGDEMAATQRRQQSGLVTSLKLDVVPNPALDIDDVVYLQRSRMGIAGYYVIDSYTCEVSTSASMQVAVRAI